ncbi:hypothetical protein ACH5RR_007148 [Cinchona calisaya]|uniref:Uncharacterized protein n=1 Tax=Cinchona calisaya TaxID=153742 RepID=A0ABD3AQY2_9GENT
MEVLRLGATRFVVPGSFPLECFPMYLFPGGFDPTSLSKAGGGSGSVLNSNGNGSIFNSKACGSPGVPLCPNPARYLHRDGLHLTQQAPRRISQVLIPDILRKFSAFNNFSELNSLL